MDSNDTTLPKSERIDSRKIIDRLFAGGKSHSAVNYPIRAVFTLGDENDAPVAQMLVSVSKRHFKRAVKRNRVKRQVREAYRKNKSLLADTVRLTRRPIYVAFLWQADRLYTSGEVEESVKRLLARIAEKVTVTI